MHQGAFEWCVFDAWRRYLDSFERPLHNYVDYGEHTNLLVPSHFAIIRVIPEEADAAFVFHFLQDKSTKQQILQNANGSSFLGTINSGFFATIQIPDVPLEKQKIIGNMVRQAKLEQFLLKHLAERKLQLRQLTIEAAYKKFKK